MLSLLWIYWDPKPELFTIPGVHWPILWYGVLFSAGFALGFPIFVHVLIRYFSFSKKGTSPAESKLKATKITDRLTVYMVVATVIGARLGHFLFYERPRDYLNDPFEIFRVWEGGLASHGAVIGILLATFFFSHRIGKKEGLDWLRTLDFVSVPTALAACFIRVGNFFNQEILGTPTDLPWAVVFGHPADHSSPVSRHPV